MSVSEAKAGDLVDVSGPYLCRNGGMVPVTVDEDRYSPRITDFDGERLWGHIEPSGRYLPYGVSYFDLVAKASVDTLIEATVRNLLQLHEEAGPSESRVQHIAARLVKAYDEALQDLDEAGEAIPRLDFEEESEGVWAAPSRTMGDDGVAFQWRISVTDKPPGAFTLTHSESELVAPKTPFPTFAMARAYAERKDWEFGLKAKREAEDEADRELASRLAGEATACGDEEEPAEATTADLITGPGRYPSRDGRVVTIAQRISYRNYRVDHYEWATDGDETYTGSGRFDAITGETHLDIIGYRIPDSLSDEAAAAHARMVAENLRRTEAEKLPADPEPEGASPFSGMTIAPKFRPEEMVSYRLEEQLSDGLWWVWWHHDQQRAKAHVYRAKSDDGWLVELAQEKTVHRISEAGVACNGNLQLVRRVKVPTTRPYTIEEVEPFVLSRFVRQRGITTGRIAITGVAPEFRDDRMRMHVEEPVLKLSMALDGESLFTMGEFLDRFEWADDGSPCGVVENVDPWDSSTAD